jgi:hypothetical protein
MKNIFAFFMLISFSVNAQNSWKHGRLRVTADGHYLKYDDGKPFFWLGDTGWELFHRLKLDEIKTYLENRKEKGFNVIQAVILAEFDGLRKPDQNGDVPLINNDPEKPNEKYFSFVDSVVQIALQKKLFMGLLPTWGDKVFKLWGVGPVIFNVVNAYDYGFFLGKRYKNFPNIIWIMGGDRPAMNDTADFRPVWRAMAAGIKKGTDGKAIFSYHPSGGDYSSSQFLFEEDWLDINMIQGGHGSGHDVEIWKLIERDRNIQPAKPTLDDEPNYEDHPVNPWPTWDPANGYYDDYDVRKQTYRSVFAGACGVTYGHHSVWQFISPREEPVNYPKIMNWKEAIDRPGAYQVGYLRKLIESRNAIDRIPDPSIIMEGQEKKAEHIESFRGADNSYAMIYLPVGKTIMVNTSFIKNKKIVAWWFDPKNAQAKKIGILSNNSSIKFTSPTSGVGNDWVLIIDNAANKFGVPGK